MIFAQANTSNSLPAYKGFLKYKNGYLRSVCDIILLLGSYSMEDLMKSYQADVIIAGVGIAGLITAYELLKKGKSVIIFDKDVEENLGGLAQEAAGGIHIIDTPEQRSIDVKDSPELAFKDWQRIAKFDDDEVWPRKWAEFYCNNSINYIYDYYKELGIEFFPFPPGLNMGSI
jgi:predicted oxidoreductase